MKRFDDYVEKLDHASVVLDADRRKDEFLAVLAHELRNPLAPIWNSVATMRMAQFDERAVRHATATLRHDAR